MSKSGIGKLLSYQVDDPPAIMLGHPTSATSWGLTPLPRRPADGSGGATVICQVCGAPVAVQVASTAETRRRVNSRRAAAWVALAVLVAWGIAVVAAGLSDAWLFGMFVPAIAAAVCVGRLSSEDGAKLPNDDVHSLKYEGINH